MLTFKVFLLFSCFGLLICEVLKCSEPNQSYHDPEDSDVVCLQGCQEGCYCRKGFRLRDNICVPAEDNDDCIKKGEFLGCGDVKCQTFCGTSRDPICALSRFTCRYGCFCKPGFIRIPSGGCVTIEQCRRFLVEEI